jgi:hypothetical protein
MVAGALKPTAEELEAFFNGNCDKLEKSMFHASHVVKYVNPEQNEEHAAARIGRPPQTLVLCSKK